MAKKTLGVKQAGNQAQAALASAAANPSPSAPASCPTCGQPNPLSQGRAKPGRSVQLVYAVGSFTPQFDGIDSEKEFAQISQGAYQGGQVDVGLLQELLRSPDNAYIGRHLRLVFASQDVDTLTLMPRHDTEIAQWLEMLSPGEPEVMVHVVVGRTVPASIDTEYAALGLPVVQPDHVLAFTLDEFAAALPLDEAAPGEGSSARGDKAARSEFEATARRLFQRFTRRPDNRGFADQDRALNYVGCRYAKLYEAVWQAQRKGKVLVDLAAQHIHAPDQRLVSVRLTFRERRTDITDALECIVDVTGVFPHMVVGLRSVYA